jgi:hypothetical protein
VPDLTYRAESCRWYIAIMVACDAPGDATFAHARFWHPEYLNRTRNQFRVVELAQLKNLVSN